MCVYVNICTLCLPTMFARALEPFFGGGERFFLYYINIIIICSGDGGGS